MSESVELKRYQCLRCEGYFGDSSPEAKAWNRGLRDLMEVLSSYPEGRSALQKQQFWGLHTPPEYSRKTCGCTPHASEHGEYRIVDPRER